LCVGERPIIDAVLAGLSEFIDPPMTSRITIAPDERLWIARRVADEVMGRAAAVLQLQLGNLVAPANAYFRAAKRYVQKLLTARGCTCSELVYSARLDHAAHLLDRRASLNTDQPLSEIAYACGFRDYTHFARKYWRRFGHAPSAYSEARRSTSNSIVRTRSGENYGLEGANTLASTVIVRQV
jgi:AraC-like DNA-binding protein